MKKTFSLVMMLCACLMTVVGIDPAFAGPREDATMAFRRGDYAGAFRLFLPLAEAGDAEAQLNLALMYDKGAGVPQSYADAFMWYRRAAQQGNVPAHHAIGLLYSKGNGVPQDYVEATRWLQGAVDRGSVEAQAALDDLYDKGLAVPPGGSGQVAPGRPASGPSRAATPFDTAPGARYLALSSDGASKVAGNNEPAGTAVPAPQGNALPAPALGDTTDPGGAALPDPGGPASFAVGATARDAWSSNPTVIAWRAVRLALSNTGEKLNTNDLEAMIRQSGLKAFALPAGELSREAAAIRIERERQQRTAAETGRRANDSWLGMTLRALTRAVVTLADPLILAGMLLAFRFLRRRGAERAK